MPVHEIRSSDGSSAAIYEHGASLCSWKSDKGEVGTLAVVRRHMCHGRVYTIHTT